MVMQFGKVLRSNGQPAVVMIDGESVHPLDLARNGSPTSLAEILHSENPIGTAKRLINPTAAVEKFAAQTWLAPVDLQEIWAAGVTYKRSKVAREEESKGAAQFYDKVYTAKRPELFLKATPPRVVHPGNPVRIRSDAIWSVPEPELALMIAPSGAIVGFTIGNDMSSRDIEGENPLYLPQAKIYKGSCSIGPVVTPVAAMPVLSGVEIRITIHRGAAPVFEGATTLAQMARSVESLAEWLFKENEFPHGAVLLTGTGIVPPDDFTLANGDVVRITIAGIGTLQNPVA
jgi:2-dehydro-3-deoxy-D-arabinonate dehydratase